MSVVSEVTVRVKEAVKKRVGEDQEFQGFGCVSHYLHRRRRVVALFGHDALEIGVRAPVQTHKFFESHLHHPNAHIRYWFASIHNRTLR